MQIKQEILCIMPLADGQIIGNDTLSSIVKQSIKVHLMPITRPESKFDFSHLFPSLAKRKRANRKSISETRNLFKNFIQHFNISYILHMDSDVILTSETDVYDLVKFLDDNKNYAVIAHDTKGNNELNKIDTDHVSMSCVMFRKEILEAYNFHNGSDNLSCNCAMMTKDVKAMKNKDGVHWKVGYLDGRKLKEIKKQFCLTL